MFVVEPVIGANDFITNLHGGEESQPFPRDPVVETHRSMEENQFIEMGMQLKQKMKMQKIT